MENNNSRNPSNLEAIFDMEVLLWRTYSKQCRNPSNLEAIFDESYFI